jgi:hypothetical protein
MSATLTNVSTALDPSDVPAVAVRELALALKMLSSGALAIPQGVLSEDDFRRVEQAFWQFSKRANSRKVAVLLRLRSLIEAMQSRRLTGLVAGGNPTAMLNVLAAAATMRLNAKWGFNPLKLARAANVAQAVEGNGALAAAA